MIKTKEPSTSLDELIVKLIVNSLTVAISIHISKSISDLILKLNNGNETTSKSTLKYYWNADKKSELHKMTNNWILTSF
jgi:hypothetical protein